MSLRLVVFDLSGTIIEDSGHVAEAFTHTMNSQALTLTPEFLQTVRGASKREVIRRLISMQNRSAELVDRIFAQFCDRLSDHYRKRGVHLIPGTHKTFEWLHANEVKIALNTGFDRTITNLIAEFLALPREWISAIVCADDVSTGRPAPDMIFRAMELSRNADVDCVANVGDTVLDLQAGYNAKTRWNIGVYSGAHTREQLLMAPHTHVLPSIASLPTVLLAGGE